MSVLCKIPILCQSFAKYQSCVSPLQNTNLVSVLCKIPILCQSFAKYQSCVSPLQNTNLVSVLCKIPILCQSFAKSAQILLVMSDRTDKFRKLCITKCTNLFNLSKEIISSFYSSCSVIYVYLTLIVEKWCHF